MNLVEVEGSNSFLKMIYPKIVWMNSVIWSITNRANFNIFSSGKLFLNKKVLF